MTAKTGDYIPSNSFLQTVHDISVAVNDIAQQRKENGEEFSAGKPNRIEQEPEQGQETYQAETSFADPRDEYIANMRNARRSFQDTARKNAEEAERKRKSWESPEADQWKMRTTMDAVQSSFKPLLPEPSGLVLPNQSTKTKDEIAVYENLSPYERNYIDSIGADPNSLLEANQEAMAPESVKQSKARKKRVEEKKKNIEKAEKMKSGKIPNTPRGAKAEKVITPEGSMTNIDDLPWQLIPESQRPRVMEVNEQGETEVRQEAPKERKLLPGLRSRLYKIPERLLKKKKMTDDEKIEAAMREQADSYIFPNAVKFEKPQERNYEEDYNAGKREPGRYDDGKSDAERKRENDVAVQREWAELLYVPVESQTIDDEGYIRFDPNTEKRIDDFMAKMGFDPSQKWLVFHMVAKRLGYSPDKDGKFLLQDSNKIPDWLFIKALNDMERSIAIHHHPYHMMDSVTYGNTLCYPIGVMTTVEAEALCRPGAVLQNKEPWEVISDARNDFVNFTLPAIRRNAHVNEGGMKQLLVLEDLVRALCSLDDISPRMYNVVATVDRGYDEMLRECDPSLTPGKDQAVNEQREATIKRAEERRNRSIVKLDRRRNRTRSVYAENVYDAKTGELLHARGERVKKGDYINGVTTAEIRSSKIHPFEAACTFTANWAKFMGVIGFAPIVVSGYVEHFVGNYYSSVSNKFLGKIFDAYGDNAEAYRPNEAMYAHMTTDEAVDAIIAWKALMRTGGQDAVIAFRQWAEQQPNKGMTKENVNKFLHDIVNKEGLFQGAMAERVKKFANKANDAIQMLLPGDTGFNRVDAKRWLEGFMVNNQINANSGDNLERSFTAQEVLEMMETMGMERFIAAATDTIAGRDAAVMMRNQTLARESPLTHIADSILRRSGLTNVLVTFGIDTYFTYGLNLVQTMVPFSNTASYLVVRGANKAITGGVKNLDEINLGILDYQMGGLDSFGQGLVKNLMYDFVKFGNVGVFGTFVAFILIAIGFDEPEDISQKYHWEEYRIGRKIGLGGTDENGNPQGIPLFRAWWLDDITLFGLPLAYSIASRSIDQQLGENDPELPGKLFWSGCYDVLSGSSVLDLTRAIKNAHETLTTYDQMMSNPDAVAPSSWFSYSYMTFFELPLAKAANKMFVPNFVRDMLKDEFDHTPYKVYDRSSKTPGKTESVDDWVELQKRIESRYNPAYALFNNWTMNGYFFDDGSTQKTGYLFNEMPLATQKDQRRMQFMEDLDYNPKEHLDDFDEYTDQKCEELISIMESYGPLDSTLSVQKAIANGFMIPYDLRVELCKYCARRQNYEENHYNQLVQDGIRGEEKNQAWTDYRNNYQKYKDILNYWAYNTDEIPWSDAGYVKLRSDTETLYYYKTTGKPASALDYILEGPGNIEKRYIPKGNTPNSFALFTTPETEGRGYNYETISEWFDENLTDVQRIFDESFGTKTREDGTEVKTPKLVPYGKDAGVPLATAIFGGAPGFKLNGKPIVSEEYNALEEPTAGYRALVPFEEKFLYDLPNFDRASLASAANGGTGNGSGSGSGSGSGNGDGSKNGNGSGSGTGNPSSANVMDSLKQITRENVDGGTLGDMGTYYDKDHWKTSSYPNYYNYGNSYGYSGGGSGGGSSNYNPKIYSTPRQVNSDKAATMYSKNPQSAKTTYLNPSFSTKGSREAYKRQDI